MPLIQRLGERVARRSIADKLEELGPNDRLNVQAKVEIETPVAAKLKGTLTVKYDGDDYLVSAEVDGRAGAVLGPIAEAYAGVAAAATFSYDELSDAKDGVRALVPFGEGDVDDLHGHLTRLQLDAGLTLELEAKLSLGVLRASGKLRLDPTISYALVFEGGATYLERVQEIEAKLEGKAVARLTAGTAMFQPDLTKAMGTANLTWTSRVKLDDETGSKGLAKAIAFVADPAGLTDALQKATHTLQATWETELKLPGDDRGTTWKLEAEAISRGDVARAAFHVLTGDVAAARRAVRGETFEKLDFVDRGADWEFDVGLGSYGIELAWRNEVRDYEDGR